MDGRCRELSLALFMDRQIEYGIRPDKDPVHVHDFHATILHLLGLDHERLTYRHDGRDYRLTDVYGNDRQRYYCLR